MMRGNTRKAVPSPIRLRVVPAVFAAAVVCAGCAGVRPDEAGREPKAPRVESPSESAGGEASDAGLRIVLPEESAGEPLLVASQPEDGWQIEIDPNRDGKVETTVFLAEAGLEEVSEFCRRGSFIRGPAGKGRLMSWLSSDLNRDGAPDISIAWEQAGTVLRADLDGDGRMETSAEIRSGRVAMLSVDAGTPPAQTRVNFGRDGAVERVEFGPKHDALTWLLKKDGSGVKKVLELADGREMTLGGDEMPDDETLLAIALSCETARNAGLVGR